MEEKIKRLEVRQTRSKQRPGDDTMLRFERTLLKPEGGTIYLTSSFYSERRELWLNFHYASFQPDHEVEIAIDPKEGTLVHSPDSGISLKHAAKEYSDRDLRLLLLYGSQTSVQGGYYMRFSFF